MQQCHYLLAGIFEDVSHHANLVPPVALPVTADACNLARAILKSLQWFKTSSSTPAERVKRRFSPYDGKEILAHRKNSDRYTATGMAPFDFYLTWRPLKQAAILNNGGVCRRYWDARRTTE